MVKRFVAALVLSGMFIASAGGTALASPGPVAAHQGQARTAATAGQQARKAARLRRQAARKLSRHAYRVTAVTGDTISALTRAGQPVTITVGVTTTYTEAGVTAPLGLSNVRPGELIVVRGTRTAPRTFQASMVRILPARMGGVVTTVNGSTITVRGPYGATYTVSTASSTVYAARQGKTLTPTTAAAVTIGQRIVVYGARGADGTTFTAVRVVLGRATTARATS